MASLGEIEGLGGINPPLLSGTGVSPSAATTTDPAQQSSKDDDAAIVEIGGKKESQQEDKTKKATAGAKGAQKTSGDDAKDQAKIQELKQRDTEVRTHEQAHLSAAGQYARSGAKFEYETGPDGKRYAVGGEVSIDVSEDKDPSKTIQKAQVIERAALAPADPSGQDRAVAAQAAQMETKARAELAKQSQEGGGGSQGSTAAAPQNKTETQEADKKSAAPTNSKESSQSTTTGKSSSLASNSYRSAAARCPVCGESLSDSHRHTSMIA